MSNKLLITVAASAISLLALSGCDKSSDEEAAMEEATEDAAGTMEEMGAAADDMMEEAEGTMDEMADEADDMMDDAEEAVDDEGGDS